MPLDVPLQLLPSIAMEPKRRIVPPVYFFVTLVLMAVLHWLVPLAQAVPYPFTWLGALPLLFGFALGGNAFRLFTRAGTPVVPFERSTALVTNGAYRVTRNPMYLGMILMLIGIAVLLGTLSPWLLIPVFALIIQANFVSGEERFLEELFGDEYVSYKKRVRRWL